MKIAEAISAAEKEAVRLRGLADERCHGLESSLQFRLSELEDQLQRQRSQLLADNERNLASQDEERAQKYRSAVHGLYQSLHRQGGAMAAFWSDHILKVSLLEWRNA